MKKILFAFVLIAMTLIAVMPAMAQNYWQQVPPAGQQIDVNKGYAGVLWANSNVHYSARINVAQADSFALALVFPDSVSLTSITMIQYQDETTTWGDTVSTSLGSLTSTNGTGKLAYINGYVPCGVKTLGNYIQFVYTFAGSGNHYAGGTALTTEKYKAYIKVYRKVNR